MNEEPIRQQPEPWATAEQIDQGRAAALERLERIRQWLAESPAEVIEARVRHEWRRLHRDRRHFRAAEWKAAKHAHESDLRHFAESVADGFLIVQTVRGFLKGLSFAAPDDHDDEVIFQ